MPATPDPELVLDGRLARSARTRTAVIDALIALFEGGDLTPTAQRVAARAGVALRTVYGHFADMEALYAEGGERQMAALAGVATPVPAGLPLEERIRLFAANRATVLEWLLPVMRASALREPTSATMARNRQGFVSLGDQETREVFAAELSGLPEDRRGDVIHLVHLVAGGPAWMALRVDRDLAPGEAGRLLHAALLAVLEVALSPAHPPGDFPARLVQDVVQPEG